MFLLEIKSFSLRTEHQYQRHLSCFFKIGKKKHADNIVLTMLLKCYGFNEACYVDALYIS